MDGIAGDCKRELEKPSATGHKPVWSLSGDCPALPGLIAELACVTVRHRAEAEDYGQKLKTNEEAS